MSILIVGGGVAGSALAFALRRAGAAVTVAEARGDGADNEGAFLTLAPNGINALRALGLGDIPAAAGGFELSGLDFHNARGHRIASLPGDDDLRDYGARGVVMRRARLRSELTARARAAGAAFSFDSRLAELHPRPGGGLHATFDDGHAVDAELVIGADGIRSTVRRLIWPAAPTPTYTGIVDCGGWTDVDLPDTARQQMHFGRQAFFGYAVKDSVAYWFSNIARTDPPQRSEPGQLDHGAWMETIRESHLGDVAPIRSILNAANSALGVWPVYDLPALGKWHTGSICLIGDAAHAVSPSTGQGASLAIEDAAVLAHLLRNERSPAVALDRFVAERKPRAERIMRFGRRIGDRKISSTSKNLFRDRTLGLFLRMGARQTVQQYSYRVPALPELPAAS